jgi:hypothetical protein
MAWQTGDAHAPGRRRFLQYGPRKNAGCPMSKLLAIVASLKAVFVMASIAFVRGDMLPVILISVLFNLAQLGTKPIGQTLPRDTIVVSSDHDDRSD